MKMQWILLGALATSGFATAQVKNVAATQGRAAPHAASQFRPTKGAPSPLLQATSQQGLALASTGADDCSLADAIAGYGSFAFDNSAGTATTGLNGQNNSPACTSDGLTAIALDVWFSWTAPATETVVLSDCGQTTVDTKIAVYDLAVLGGVCPPNGFAATVADCNDDMSAYQLQTKLVWNATIGSVYLIQLGAYPGGTPTGGTGSFTISAYPPSPDATPCQTDTGDADGVTRATNTGNTEQLVLQPFGLPGDLTQVNNILVSYGAGFLPGQAVINAITNGTAVNVCIYDDPTDDFDPSDAVLVQSVASTVQQIDTDLFNTVPLSPSVVVSGVYFVGWSIVHPATVPANFWPFGHDDENCEAFFDNWSTWNLGAPLDYNTLSANSNPPVILGFQPFGILTTNAAWMVRPDCQALTSGTAFCFGDGTFTDHTTACPCGNFSATPGRGCAHSFGAGDGAEMTASGSTTLDDVVLHSRFEPVSSFTLMMQHGNSGDVVFHDGVLCASNPLIRLRGRAAVAGEAFFPNSLFAQDSTTTLSIRGGVTIGSGTRYYAGWYRNASTTFCPPATANVTNGWQIVW